MQDKNISKQRKLVYFDNASTSFPRCPGLSDTIRQYIEEMPGNLNRGNYGKSYELSEGVFSTREKILNFFNAGQGYNAIFTNGGTTSLNLFLKGFLKRGDHIIVSPFEHNAVVRPLERLRQSGVVDYSIMKPNGSYIDLYSIEKLIKKNTKAIVCNHASNVTGDVQDIESIGQIAKKYGLVYCIDGCQSAGVVPIDICKSNISFLAFTSHKGLMALPGSGGAIISPELNLFPLIEGGTGSHSEYYDMPDFLPDRFEAGTQNIPGILSIGKSIDYIKKETIEKIWLHKLNLRNYFIKKIKKNFSSEIKIIGSDESSKANTGIVSLVFKNLDSAVVSDILDSQYSIATRVGLQCALLAHKSLGTFDSGGTLRFSFSYFNTFEEIDACVNALKGVVFDTK